MESELFGHAKGALHRRRADARACCRWPTAAPFSSTKSARCRCRCRPSSSASSSGARSRRSAPRRRAVSAKCNVIAATNRNLAREVSRARADLFMPVSPSCACACLRCASGSTVSHARRDLPGQPARSRRRAHPAAAVAHRAGASIGAAVGERNVAATPSSARRSRSADQRAQARSGAPRGVHQGARDRFVGEFERRYLTDILERCDLNVSRRRARPIDRRNFRRLLAVADQSATGDETPMAESMVKAGGASCVAARECRLLFEAVEGAGFASCALRRRLALPLDADGANEFVEREKTARLPVPALARLFAVVVGLGSVTIVPVTGGVASRTSRSSARTCRTPRPTPARARCRDP